MLECKPVLFRLVVGICIALQSVWRFVVLVKLLSIRVEGEKCTCCPLNPFNLHKLYNKGPDHNLSNLLPQCILLFRQVIVQIFLRIYQQSIDNAACRTAHAKPGLYYTGQFTVLHRSVHCSIQSVFCSTWSVYCSIQSVCCFTQVCSLSSIGLFTVLYSQFAVLHRTVHSPPQFCSLYYLVSLLFYIGLFTVLYIQFAVLHSPVHCTTKVCFRYFRGLLTVLHRSVHLC